MKSTVRWRRKLKSRNEWEGGGWVIKEEEKDSREKKGGKTK